MVFPPAGIVVGGGALTLGTLAGASIGGLASGLVGTGFDLPCNRNGNQGGGGKSKVAQAHRATPLYPGNHVTL